MIARKDSKGEGGRRHRKREELGLSRLEAL